jgi:glycosyltransferase involved in cell wall biosynthesis
MKILYHHRIASKDGQFIHLRAILNQLKLLNHDVFLVGPDISTKVDMGGGKTWVQWLKRSIPQPVYELIELGYSLLDFVKMAVVIIKNRPEAIYERENLYFVSGVWAAKLFGLPLIVEVNAPLFIERARYDGIALPGLARWSENYVWKNADCLLPVTEVLANIIRGEVTPKNLQVIANGIDPEELEIHIEKNELLKQLGLEGKRVLGFVGFVRDWHKLDRILKYVAEKDDESLCLLVVGEGPDITRLQQVASNLGISKQLIITGVIQRNLMASYINLFDIAIQPAVTAYASPLKLFEYLHLGRTIIAPDTPNIREVLSDGEDSLLFEDSQSSIASVLDSLMDKEYATFLGQKAKITIENKRFYWKDNAIRIMSIVGQLK